MIFGQTLIKAPCSLVSVSVIAAAGSSWPGVKESFYLLRSFVKINVLYPACVAFTPEGAENKKSMTGTL